MPSPDGRRRYLALDFGAESGRAVLAHLHAGVITTEEIHRFPNEPVEYAGSRHWDVMRLWLEVRRSLSKLEEFELSGIGVDAWGVDYALLGEGGELLQNSYHYRDATVLKSRIQESVVGYRAEYKKYYEAWAVPGSPKFRDTNPPWTAA